MANSPQFGRRGMATAPAYPAQGYGQAARPSAPGGSFGLSDLMRLMFGFEGRIRRLHYWLAGIGAWLAISMTAGLVVDMVLGAGLAQCQCGTSFDSLMQVMAGPSGGTILLIQIPVLFLETWINFALQVKRWHDRDKSWAWLFIGFIPIVGPLWVFIECGFFDGTPGDNRYGPSPKS